MCISVWSKETVSERLVSHAKTASERDVGLPLSQKLKHILTSTFWFRQNQRKPIKAVEQSQLPLDRHHLPLTASMEVFNRFFDGNSVFLACRQTFPADGEVIQWETLIYECSMLRLHYGLTIGRKTPSASICFPYGQSQPSPELKEHGMGLRHSSPPASPDSWLRYWTRLQLLSTGSLQHV